MIRRIKVSGKQKGKEKVISMYTTGELAKMNKISQRTLRYYDSIGLLHPTIIKENGYRYYSDNDLERLFRILELKKFQIPLNLIKEILDSNDNDLLKQVLLNQISLLQKKNLNHGHLIIDIERKLRAIKNIDFFEPISKSYDICIGYREDFLALCQRKKASLSEVSHLIDELYKCVEDSKYLIPTGPHLAIFYDDFESYNPDLLDVEVCLPVNAEFTSDNFSTRTVQGGECISTIHFGNYELIGDGYRTLLDWAIHNGFTIRKDSFERYFKDIRDTAINDSFITEIYLPLNEYKE